MKLDHDHPLLNTVTVCDGGQHEARVITDGAYVYAYLLDGYGDADTATVTEGTPGVHPARELQLACPYVDTVSDESCHGYIELSLDGHGTDRSPAWVTAGDDPEGADALSSYGGAVEL